MAIIYNTKQPLLASIFFVLVGFFSCLYLINDWKLAVPSIIFYIILVVNTYFSISTFVSATPSKSFGQNFFNLSLVIVYIFLALNIGKPFWFSLWGGILFFIAVLKYLNLGAMIGFSKLLKRKISVDFLGLLAFLLAFSGVLMGFDLLSMWILVIAFAVVNFYIFFINPLYTRTTV